MPQEIAFATKGEMVRAQIEAALAAGIRRGPVLIDAGYGDEADLRDWLSARIGLRGSDTPGDGGMARRTSTGARAA